MENNANEDEDLYSEESIKKLIEQVYKTTPLHVPFCLKCLKCGHPQEKCVSRKDKYGKLLPFVNGDQRSKQSARRARPENSLRGVSFCRWLKDLVSQENLSNGCILDVAGGGKGGLSFQLAINEDIKCVVVDPRIVKFKKKHRRRLNHQIKKKKGRVWDFDFDLFIDNPFEDELFQILFEQEMKEEHFQKIKQNIERNRELEELENQSDGDESEDIDEDQYDEESEDMDASEDSDKNDIENEIILDYTSSFCSIHENLAYVEHMINLPNQILAWFDEDFVLKYPKLWEECSLVLGMHPDQATEPIVDLSLKYNKPFAIVPCCVFPNSNPHRKLKTGENVRSYEQFCQYLLEKDERIKSFDISQFQGRNKSSALVEGGLKCDANMASIRYSLIHREIGFNPSYLRKTQREKRIKTLQLSKRKSFLVTHTAPILSLDIDPIDSRYLLSASIDKGITLYDTYDLGDNKITQPLNVTENDQKHEFGVTSVQWYPCDTGMFITSSYDKTVGIWDTNTFQMVFKFFRGSPVGDISLPQASYYNLIACGSYDPIIHICDLKSGKTCQTLKGHRQEVSSLQWSPKDEFLLASASHDNTVLFWDIRRSGSFLYSLDQQNTNQNFNLENSKNKYSVMKKQNQIITAHDGKVTGLKFTPDGNYLLSTGNDNKLRLWDTNTALNTFVNYQGISNLGNTTVEMGVSYDGKYLFHPNLDNIGMYDIFSGRKIQVLKGHFSHVNCCLMLHDREELYSGSQDRHILVWIPEDDEKDFIELENDNDQDDWSSDED